MKLDLAAFKRIHELKDSGYNEIQVGHKTNISRYHIHKVWNYDECAFLGTLVKRFDEFEPYQDYILELLETKRGISNSLIYDWVKAEFGSENVTFCKSKFSAFMKYFRAEKGYVIKSKSAYRTRIKTSLPGEEAQVDLGQYKMINEHGYPIKVYFFCMVLSYSRMKYLYFSGVPFKTSSFIYAHDRAFMFFGGRPHTIKYDQDRVQVVSENAGDIIYTKGFEKFIDEVGYNVYMCRGGDPATKGKVERVIRHVKEGFLPHRTYYNIERLNKEAMEWLERTGNGEVHSVTHKKPIDMYEDEKKSLVEYIPAEMLKDDERIVAVRPNSCFGYKNNIYSLPVGYYEVKDRVRLIRKNNMLSIVDIITGEIVVEHEVCTDVGQVIQEYQQPPLPDIYFRMVKEFGKYKGMKEYLEKVAMTLPRYVRDQMNILYKALGQYDKKDVVTAIRAAIKERIYSTTEVIAILMKLHGASSAGKTVSKKLKPIYKKRSVMLSVYDEL